MHILDASKGAVTVKCVDIPFGGQMYLCFVAAFPYPVGFVWGVGDTRGVFDVAGSYTEPWARRQGVRTRLNEEIFKEYLVIRTNYGSAEGGQAFMRKQGYKFSRALRCYYLARPKAVKCRK